jgi:hypothetical protein
VVFGSFLYIDVFGSFQDGGVSISSSGSFLFSSFRDMLSELSMLKSLNLDADTSSVLQFHCEFYLKIFYQGKRYQREDFT